MAFHLFIHFISFISPTGLEFYLMFFLTFFYLVQTVYAIYDIGGLY